MHLREQRVDRLLVGHVTVLQILEQVDVLVQRLAYDLSILPHAAQSCSAETEESQLPSRRERRERGRTIPQFVRGQVEELLALSTMVLRFDPSRLDGANVQLLGLLDAINVGDGPDEPSVHTILGEGADPVDAASDQRPLNSFLR